jgi:hypothetical protein
VTTAGDIIQSSFEEINAYGVGETINTAHSARALAVLNNMLDSWNTERLAVYAWQTISFALTPNKASYTIGTSGSPDINNTRPQDLRQGPGAAYLQDTNLNNYGLEVVPQDKWQMIGNRSVNSQVPDTLWYDPQYPNGTINIFPVPSLAYTVFCNAVLQLAQFASLTSTFTFPPGYAQAIQKNLSVQLKPYFPAGGPLNPLIIEAARESKGNIKRGNIREIVAVYEDEIVSRGAPTYNIYRDRGAI